MKKIFERLVTIALLLVAVNMDTQSGKRSVDLEPSFAPLQAGQGSFMAVVHDGSMAVEVEDLSFFGHTSLGHVKSEDNDSVCEFDLAEITTLEVIQPHFDSSKFSDQVFTKISITTLSQAAEKSNDAPKTRTVENLLVPRNIIVCGKERSTGIKRAWFISKINKIVVQHADIDKKIAFIAKKNARSKNSHQKKDDASLPKESDYHQEQPSVNNQAVEEKGLFDYLEKLLNLLKELVFALYRLIRSFIIKIIALLSFSS